MAPLSLSPHRTRKSPAARGCPRSWWRSTRPRSCGARLRRWNDRRTRAARDRDRRLRQPRRRPAPRCRVSRGPDPASAAAFWRYQGDEHRHSHRQGGVGALPLAAASRCLPDTVSRLADRLDEDSSLAAVCPLLMRSLPVSRCRGPIAFPRRRTSRRARFESVSIDPRHRNPIVAEYASRDALLVAQAIHPRHQLFRRTFW